MTPEQLNTFLQQGKYRELLLLAEQERKAHPDAPIFAAIVATCLNGLLKHGKARNLARDATRKFPNDPQLHFELGQAYLALREPDEAEEAYLRAIELIGTRDDVLKSVYMTSLGGAQWDLRKRENAIATWREAFRLDPENDVAHEMLDKHLNQYSEPKAPNPVFDDLYHFYAIHQARYFQSRGKHDQEFESKEEFEHVNAAMVKAWNERMTPHKDRIDGMSPAEKTELFSSVQIDFTEEIPPSEMARPFTKEELAAFRSTEQELEPEFEEMEKVANILFSIPLLAIVGFPQTRLDKIIEGSEPTAMEEETLAWAADIVAAVFDAIEFAGTDTEVEAMMDAVAIACERLAPEEAPVAVHEVHSLIEAFIAETVEGEKRKSKGKRRRKKRKGL